MMATLFSVIESIMSGFERLEGVSEFPAGRRKQRKARSIYG